MSTKAVKRDTNLNTGSIWSKQWFFIFSVQTWLQRKIEYFSNEGSIRYKIYYRNFKIISTKWTYLLVIFLCIFFYITNSEFLITNFRQNIYWLYCSYLFQLLTLSSMDMFIQKVSNYQQWKQQQLHPLCPQLQPHRQPPRHFPIYCNIKRI